MQGANYLQILQKARIAHKAVSAAGSMQRRPDSREVLFELEVQGDDIFPRCTRIYERVAAETGPEVAAAGDIRGRIVFPVEEVFNAEGELDGHVFKAAGE